MKKLLLLCLATLAWASCKDKLSRCKLFDAAGYCYSPKHFITLKRNCELTCNLCDQDAPELPPVPVTPGPALSGCGRRLIAQGRVIGGVDAPHGAWPWQVGLYVGDNDLLFFCGGSLVSPEWVVTAAHCINPMMEASDFRIRLGDWHRFYNDGSEQIIGVSKVIVHPDYNKQTPINNDIAMIKLLQPATLTSHVNTVCLPSKNVDVPLDSTCFITGWGKVKHPGGSYSKLQQAKLPLVSEQECKEKLAASPAGQLLNVTQQMVCAGDIQGQERGGCHGDSGGPFVCLDESAGGRFVLQGAVSWGSANCNFEQQNKQYSVFVRISEFRGWIDDNMRNN